MADERLSESYSPQGKQLPFQEVLNYTQQYIQGETSGLVGKQSPAAVDRRTGTPIYKLDPVAMSDIAKSHRSEMGFAGKYHAPTSWRPDLVTLNPQRINPRDFEKVQNVIDHEMFHRHQFAKPEIVTNIISRLIDVGGKPLQWYDDVRSALTSVSPGYKPELSDLEAQAMSMSNTLPGFYSGREDIIPRTTPVPTLFSRDKVQQPKVTDPDVTATLQRTMYGVLPRDVQRRYESRLIPIEGDKKKEGVSEKGYLQSAVDSFMSILRGK